ncbi:MAG: multicopper oxidase domain-containing protein, partial [Dehalococcoidia bacterium]
METQVNTDRQSRIISGLIGSATIATLLGLLIAVSLGACGTQPTASPEEHFDPPGTPPHTHAPPGSAGEVLQKRLQEQLPPQTPSGHQGSEGLTLGGNPDLESVYAGALCDPEAEVKEYNIVAINVEITLNRFLDHDPQGLMYVLEEGLERVRDEEVQNRLARLDQASPAVSLGLQGDAIQPLIIRVSQGECLRISLRNSLKNDQPASFHLHGSSLHLASTGAPALATNPKSVAGPGKTVIYQWMIDRAEPEGTHYFHSHGNTRAQTGHGLFGAVIVEPAGSKYLDPWAGDELRSGWSAIIQDPRGSHFREFAIVYHEIGNERYRHRDKQGVRVPLIDPITSSYKPGGRALNYRSEPFMNRMALQQEVAGLADPSQAYSSYVFGDPATPLARSYLGDPVKERVIHGGSEVFHVHHVHGGATRWRRQSGVEPTSFDTGFNKNPDLLPRASSRIDSQAIGPSESYDLEHECGSGGCQESAGDFLAHCHVAHHYISGMWMIWRVYNTLQDGVVSQDDLPPLRELPDRPGGVAAAVTSEKLPGTQVGWKGQTFQISRDNLSDWVEDQLPPRGAAKGYDAAVLDWRRQDNLYLNEPDTDQVWPNYSSESPGQRLPLYFNPQTGKLAYPFLRPHLGQRPPFAPNHGPAPFLEPMRTGTGPSPPGANGPWGLCPAGTQSQEFVVHAINLPITLSERANIIDPVGQLYVLKEQEEAIRADNGRKIPLVIRANASQDCLDIIFKSELADTGENDFFSKVNIHIHFVQFDIQASDGVNTGYNYEQSVRPFTVEGETLRSAALAGASSLELSSAQRFQPGILVGVGMDQGETFEVKRIAGIEGNSIVFEEPLQYPHAAGEIVSVEFVRYRWYPDVQFGTAYFHDHVSALTSWKHGLFGALIAEPPDSTYHDPKTGEEVRSGELVDIHTDSVVSVDVTGSFRELVLFIQDDVSLTHLGDSSGSAFNLRVEPLRARPGDPSQMFNSSIHGDPETPLLEAFAGDPIVVRGLVSAMNDVHTLHVDGHWFRAEPHSSTSPPISTVHIGISERYDLVIPQAGGPLGFSGDYLYYNGRSFKLAEGSWGILRVYNGTDQLRLQKLPGREVTPPTPAATCPPQAPLRQFSVAVIEAPLPMLDGAKGKVYVLQRDREAIQTGTKVVEPLVLHANVGDCLQVELHNELDEGQVSFHADMLAYDPSSSAGINSRPDSDQTVEPGHSKTYTFFAHPEVGPPIAQIRDFGHVLE